MGDLPIWLLIFLAALATALATGIGALPFAFTAQLSARARGYANAIAAGLMLGACEGLAREGSARGVASTLIGALGGALFVLVAKGKLAKIDVTFERTRGVDARRMLLMVLVMTVHSAAEGIAVGASFAGGQALALAITVAIAVHNIPEGVAITAVLRPQGVSLLRCAGWSIFSSLPQPLLAVPAFLFVDAFHPALPYSLGFAAGAMVFMAVADLLPEAFEMAPRLGVILVTALSLAAMVLFQRIL